MRNFRLHVPNVDVLVLTLPMLWAKITIDFLPTKDNSGNRDLNLPNSEVFFPLYIIFVANACTTESIGNCIFLCRWLESVFSLLGKVWAVEHAPRETDSEYKCLAAVEEYERGR